MASFKFQVTILGVLAGLMLLAILELHHRQLQQDFPQSLAAAVAGERRALRSCRVRAKTLEAAREVSRCLENSRARSFEELEQDRDFRRLALQALEAAGATFILAAPQGRVLLYSQSAPPGSEAARMAQWRRLSSELGRVYAREGSQGICELEMGQDSCYSRAVVVPVLPRLSGGPELLVAALFDPQGPDPHRDSQGDPPAAGLHPDHPLNRVQTLLWLGGMGALWLFAGLVLARRHGRRVRTLIKAAQAYNAGNLAYRIPHPGRDEMGLLAETLNRMAAGLQENTVSRLEWENTFNVIPDQIMVLDREQRILRLNQAAAAHLRISPEEAAGGYCYELWHGKAAPPEFCAFSQALESGTRRRVECVNEAGDRTFLVTVDPMRNAAGEICGGVHVARDITAFKRIEQELAQASQFLNQVIESTPVALVVVDRQGLLVRVNPQFFHEYGYNQEEVVGRHYSSLYASSEEVKRVVQELREQGQVLSRITYFRHRNGQIVPTRVSIRKLRGSNGELLGSVGVGRNISDEVSLQRQLEQAQKLEAIATLSGGLAHNFNNQLTIIMGLTNLMLSKTAPDHQFHRDLKEIEQQVQAGRELTQKLLTFARGATFKMQPLDLNNLVQMTVDMFARTRRDLVVAKELASGVLPVVADPSQMQQVLMNLLINAWQAMPGGGKIAIATGTEALAAWADPAWDLKPGEYAFLRVADNGEGMDETVMGRIFEPFFTTKKPGQGTGLGLASAYRIIKNHHGAILVESTPGAGSTFTIYLPVSSAQPQILPAADHQLVTGHATILVVDDEPVLRRVCARLLNKLGYRVLEAPGGEEALELFKERGREIDLVLLDLIMPGLNGIQTLERLREMEPGARVLLCSGYGDKAGENLPPDVGFIAKPYTLEFLSQKVAEALKG